MGFSIFDISRCILLILNAMAILNERRFLNKYGIVPPNGSGGSAGSPLGDTTGTFSNDFGSPTTSPSGGDGGSSLSVKHQVGQLLFSVRLLLRWPIVIANVIMVVLTIVFG